MLSGMITLPTMIPDLIKKMVKPMFSGTQRATDKKDEHHKGLN
jgi:hypothetical protein